MLNLLKSERVRLRIHAAVALTALYLASRGVITLDDAGYVGALLTVLLAVDGTTSTVAKQRKARQNESH